MRYTIRSIQRAAQRPDQPGDAERRVREREAGERAHREMMERFAPLTAANAQTASEWQESRLRELIG